METGVISTEGMSSMVTDSIVMIDVECQPLLRGVGRMRLDGKMTDALTVLGRGFQSTPGTQTLMRDLSSCRAWSTETKLTEMAMTEARKPAIGCMSLAQSASAELSELQ